MKENKEYLGDLAKVLGVEPPKTRRDEIDLICLALMGDKEIMPIDRSEVYCEKLKLSNNSRPEFTGSCTASQEDVVFVMVQSFLCHYPEIKVPNCEPLNM